MLSDSKNWNMQFHSFFYKVLSKAGVLPKTNALSYSLNKHGSCPGQNKTKDWALVQNAA